MWQSLIESITDYLPGRSSAPLLLLPHSSTSVCDGSSRGLSDTSEETDSAVVMEEGIYSESSSVVAPTSIQEDPMESLLATQARAKDAQASGVELLKEILDLISLGKCIRDGLIDHIPSESNESGHQTDRIINVVSPNSLLTRLTREFVWSTKIRPFVRAFMLYFNFFP